MNDVLQKFYRAVLCSSSKTSCYN